MLNVDTKILSKALTKKIKEVLPCLISGQQVVYVQNRDIGENRRLISDIEITNIRQMESSLVTMDLKKAFDSLDHNFLISVLKKFGFGQNFISSIGIILKNQKSCVTNGGITTKYFKLNNGVVKATRFKLIHSFRRLKFYFFLLKKIHV